MSELQLSLHLLSSTTLKTVLQFLLDRYKLVSRFVLQTVILVLILWSSISWTIIPSLIYLAFQLPQFVKQDETPGYIFQEQTVVLCLMLWKIVNAGKNWSLDKIILKHILEFAYCKTKSRTAACFNVWMQTSSSLNLQLEVEYLTTVLKRTNPPTSLTLFNKLDSLHRYGITQMYIILHRMVQRLFSV